MTTFLLLALLAADPTPEQLMLLKTFKEEFVAIKTDGSNLKPYSIARYEVPQNLWEAVMGGNPSRWKGPRNSVEMLNHAEALEFCSRATDLMRAAALIDKDQTVRLPTEGQWDWAARARTTTKYSFGDDPAELGDYAWFTGNAKGNDPPVGAKKPNLWGLYDVHGYLWEWTESGVLRSGSWKDPAELLTTASRRVVDRGLRDDAVGLRCVLVATRAAQPAAPAEFKPTAQDKIVPAGSKLEMLWNEGEFTEGPALAPDGSIFFSDIGNAIYRYDPKTGKTAVFRQPSGRSNGLKFDQQGRLIACEGANSGGGRRISITTGIVGAKDGEVKTLADKFDGKRFNSPNDLAIDGQGRVYFTDPRYVGDEPRELDFEAVFFVTTEGVRKVATREVTKPNGILVSPHGKTVYVSENNPQGARQLLAFSVLDGAGSLGKKQVLWDFGTGRGIDGMTLDREGNIYATAGTGDKAGVYVFAADGKNLAFIPTPGDPTNCCFGGGDYAGMLFVTCANSKTPGTKYGLYKIKLNAVGYAVVKLAQ